MPSKEKSPSDFVCNILGAYVSILTRNKHYPRERVPSHLILFLKECRWAEFSIIGKRIYPAAEKV